MSAPAGARFARFQFWANTVTGADPYAWFMHPMLEQVRTTDTVPSLWADSSVGLDEKYSQVTQAIEARTTVNENGIAQYRASWTMSLDANGRVAAFAQSTTKLPAPSISFSTRSALQQTIYRQPGAAGGRRLGVWMDQRQRWSRRGDR